MKGVVVNYIRTKPIYHSQLELGAKKGRATFRVEEIPNYELRNVFDSYGKALRVVISNKNLLIIQSKLIYNTKTLTCVY